MLARIPIAGQILALVALGILATAAAMMAITFAGPPPRQPPMALDDAVRALQGDHAMAGRFEIGTSANPAAEAGDLVADPDLARDLARRLDAPQGQVLAYTGRPEPGMGPDMRPPHGIGWGGPDQAGPPDRGFQLLDHFLLARQLPGGRWTTLRSGPDRSLARWQAITAATIALVALASLGLALLAAWRITGPIERLAQAARSRETAAVLDLAIPDGPPEVAQAARALRDFTRRNEELSEQRLAMMLAMAHDIGTPLARLAFRNEHLPDALREAALRDFETIRRLLSDSLLLARGWTRDFAPVELAPVDLASLCRSIALRETQTGRKALVHCPDTALLNGHAGSLERMVQNLIDNAIRYGGEADVVLAAQGDRITLTVTDRGPGFPDMPQSELLKPFVRGEGSRNDQTGGSGLGLAIAAQVVSLHRGTMELTRAVMGGGLAGGELADGGQVRVVLPV